MRLLVRGQRAIGFAKTASGTGAVLELLQQARVAHGAVAIGGPRAHRIKLRTGHAGTRLGFGHQLLARQCEAVQP